MTEINKSHLILSITNPSDAPHGVTNKRQSYGSIAFRMKFSGAYGVFFDKVTVVGQIDKFKI